VKYFDKRIQSLEISSSRIPTKEKKELIVDLFTKWRIKDFAKFYNTTSGGNKVRAEQLLREKIVDGLRGEFGRRNLNDVVSQDRQSVMDKIRTDANNTAQILGIEVVDARIVRIELPQEVSEAVFNLMRTERQRVAAEHRAQGQSRAEAIRADADAKVTILRAQAEREALQTRGDGDGQAAKIYADVYGKDPEFYSFYRSMEAYRETFKRSNDMLVIKPDDAFFRYFRRSVSSEGQAKAQ
jgi:membrane protease subunit HflC